MSRSKFTNHIRLGLNEIGKDMDFNIEGSHDLWSVKTRDSGEWFDIMCVYIIDFGFPRRLKTDQLNFSKMYIKIQKLLFEDD